MSSKEEECSAADRAAIFEQLRANGVLRAVVSYAGYGDSGGMEDVYFEMPDGSKLPDIEKVRQHSMSSQYCDGVSHVKVALGKIPLDEAIVSFASDAVDKHYGGWENDDGASGHVFFEVADGSVSIRHTAFFTESYSSEVQL